MKKVYPLFTFITSSPVMRLLYIPSDFAIPSASRGRPHMMHKGRLRRSRSLGVAVMVNGIRPDTTCVWIKWTRRKYFELKRVLLEDTNAMDGELENYGLEMYNSSLSTAFIYGPIKMLCSKNRVVHPLSQPHTLDAPCQCSDIWWKHCY